MYSRIIKFFKYWYLRYSLVTELYMVEPWERFVIQTIFLCFFFLLWYVNFSVVTSSFTGISKAVGFMKIDDDMDSSSTT